MYNMMSTGSDVEEGDLVLIEPSLKINNDTVLFISKDRQCIGKIYYHSSAWIIQPLKSASEPINVSSHRAKEP